MKYINKLVRNKGNTTEPCLEILGDLNGLHAIANIWDNYADLIHIIGINEFLEWTKKEFSKEQSVAYQEGLQAFPKFFEKCYKEVKARELLKGSKPAGSDPISS